MSSSCGRADRHPIAESLLQQSRRSATASRPTAIERESGRQLAARGTFGAIAADEVVCSLTVYPSLRYGEIGMIVPLRLRGRGWLGVCVGVGLRLDRVGPWSMVAQTSLL